MEVDMVMEEGDGRLLGIEVKAAATVTNRDFNGLRRLQRVAGGRFHRGVLLYDGEHLSSLRGWAIRRSCQPTVGGMPNSSMTL